LRLLVPRVTLQTTTIRMLMEKKGMFAATRLKCSSEEDLIPKRMLNADVHPPHPRGRRALQEQQWRPLRIVPEYLNMDGLTTAQQTYLKDEIIAPMIVYAG